MYREPYERSGYFPCLKTFFRPLETRYTEAARIQPSAKLAKAVPATANVITMDQTAAFLAPASSMQHRTTSVTANHKKVQSYSC